MIKTLLFDFSRVLLHPTDKTYKGSLNNLHRELKDNESYYLFNYFELNQELLDYLKTVKNKFELCIFTTDIIQIYFLQFLNSQVVPDLIQSN